MLGGTFAMWLHQGSAVFVVVGMAAVFGAAARVPVATMLMVTEMAGGYHLLLPAGIAVMISYLLQAWLSSFVRYRSLYEDQVPTPSDSPARYKEHIQLALRLLGKRSLPTMKEVGHFDLLRLLRARVRFDLPGGRELAVGIVEDDSPVVGATIGWLYQKLDQYEFEIIAILRREHVLLPHTDTLFRPDDRLILIKSPRAYTPLTQYLRFSDETGDKPL